MADYWDDELEDIEVEDMFVGALLGGAIGDTLGCFCEGWPPGSDQSSRGIDGPLSRAGQSGRCVDPTSGRIYRRYPANPRPRGVNNSV